MTDRASVRAITELAEAAERRNADIVARAARGETLTSIAARYSLSGTRAGVIARAAGVATRAGRRPTGAATHHTARGRALLAQLVADAAEAGVEPEAYLAGRGGASTIAEATDLIDRALSACERTSGQVLPYHGEFANLTPSVARGLRVLRAVLAAK